MPEFSMPTLLLIIAGLMVSFAAIWYLVRIVFLTTKKRSSNQSQLAIKSDIDLCVFYASQRGRAKQLAMQTADAFRLNGKTVECLSLSELLSPAELAQYKQCVFIVSTFGSGQAPESSRKFAKKLKKTKLDLSSMRMAVLALGDKQYDRFCGFGFTLNGWLKKNQAIEMLPMITVNQMNKSSVAKWHEFIQSQGGDPTAFNNSKQTEYLNRKD